MTITQMDASKHLEHKPDMDVLIAVGLGDPSSDDDVLADAVLSDTSAILLPLRNARGI